MNINLEKYLIDKEELKGIKNEKYRNLLYSSNENLKGFAEEIKSKDDKIQLRILSSHKSGTIDLPTLNNVTKGLQLVYTNGYNFKAGNHAIRGKISEKIKVESSLLLTNTKAGSFILEIKRNEKSQLTIDEENKDTFYILDETFQDLDEENVKGLIQEVGFRTFKSLKEWYKDLNKNDIEFIYSNRNSDVNVSMNKNKIKRISAKLDSINLDDEKREVLKTGKIKHVDHHNNYIIFEDDENERYKIKIIGDTFKNITIQTNTTQQLKFEEVINKIEGETVLTEYKMAVARLISKK